MHDQSVSGLIVPEDLGMLGEARRDAERGSVPHRALRHLAQIEDQISRRQRVPGRSRGARGVALAAFRAGVQIEEVLGRERVDERVADVGGFGVGVERREPVARPLILHGHADGSDEHVDGLRERDRRHPEEREDSVHPPVRDAGVVCGLSVEADGDEPFAHEPADRRPDLEVGIMGRNAKGLEEEACQCEEEETPEEDPVAQLIAFRLVAERLSRLDRPPVAEAERTQDPALHREDRQADDEGRPEKVEEERVAEVEPAVPEVEAEHRVREVVLEGKDGRAGEEHQEAVEDEQVPEPGERVAPPNPGVGDDDPRRILRALETVPDHRCGHGGT